MSSADPAVHITVVDHDLAPVDEGVHRLTLNLPPGVYAVRFEAGASVREQLVSLRPGSRPVEVQEKRIAFATAAPLAGTSTDAAEQGAAAARLSLEVHRKLGRGGGRLMVFVRDTDLRARSNPAHDLDLHDASGHKVGTIERDGGSGGGDDRSHPPWAACTYELEPGCWRLRGPAAGGDPVEQAVYVCRNWQTQVFLERREAQHGRKRRPDLAGASVLMAKPKSGFDPERSDLRIAELARQGLRDRRTVVPEDELRGMLYTKRENPMLAIYGAHLIVHRETPDRGLVAEVARNLRKLVGDHPDVRALDLWLRPDADVTTFETPPMLRSSWKIVIAASANRPDLVPRGSLSAAIARRVFGGGPWLRWRAVAEQPRENTVAPAGAPMPLGAALAHVVDALPRDRKAVLEQAGDSPAVESGVIAYACQAGEELEAITDEDVVRSLGVPRTVAEDAMMAVIERLDG